MYNKNNGFIESRKRNTFKVWIYNKKKVLPDDFDSLLLVIVDVGKRVQKGNAPKIKY